MEMTAGQGRLRGKQVLVTGGTTGFGLAMAERFLREGARVVVTGRDQELGARAQAPLGHGQAKAGRAPGHQNLLSPQPALAGGHLHLAQLFRSASLRTPHCPGPAGAATPGRADWPAGAHLAGVSAWSSQACQACQALVVAPASKESP